MLRYMIIITEIIVFWISCSWIMDCGKHDKEFAFSQRLTDRASADKTYFGKVSFYSAKAAVTEGTALAATSSDLPIDPYERSFQVGNRVTFVTRKSNHPIFAHIESFMIKEQLPLVESSFRGNGFLRYYRLPQAIFGDKVMEEQFSSLSEISLVRSVT
jgi:plastocyanin